MNPMIKPAIVSAPLLVWSVLVGLCVLYLVPATIATWPAPVWLTTIALVLLAFTALLAVRWIIKTRRARSWSTQAKLQWQRLETVKKTAGTTTEVAVISVQEVQPTGAWVTINWTQFGYTQPAWIEGAGGTYWPGSVLLITPDPNQVHIGQPWPPTYRVAESDCVAIAPSGGY